MRRRSLREQALAVTLAVSLLIPLGRVAAEPGPPQVAKIFLVRIQAAPDVSLLIPRRLTEQLRAELGTAEVLELLPDEDAVSAGAPPPKKAVDRREQARKALDEGREALGRSDYKQALTLLEESIQDYEQSVAVLDNVRPLAYGFVLLAIAQARLGKERASVEAFRRALTLQPRSHPKLAGQPRKVRRAFDRARKFLRRPNGGLTVTSRPGGVDIFVDGRPSGQTPAVLDLPPGIHYVRAARKGYVPAGARVEVKSGQSGQTQLHLAATSAAAAGGGDAVRAAVHGEIIKRVKDGAIDGRLKETAQRFCARTGAAYLLVGHVSRTADGYILRSYLYRQQGDRLVELDAAKFDSELLNLAAGVYKLAEHVVQATRHFPEGRDIINVNLALGTGGAGGGPGGTIDGPVAVTGESGPPIDIRRPAWRTWWFWTAVGLVVAGGAATAGFMILRPPHDGLVGGQVTVR